MEFNLGLFVLWSHTDGSLSMFITSEAQQNIMLYSAYMLSPVRLSVCPSHGWTIQKRLKLGLWNFHHTEAPSSGRIIVYDGARKIWRAIASLENLFLRRWGPLRSHISGSKKPVMTQLEMKLTNSNRLGGSWRTTQTQRLNSSSFPTSHCLTASSFPHWVDCLSVCCIANRLSRQSAPVEDFSRSGLMMNEKRNFVFEIRKCNNFMLSAANKQEAKLG